MFLKKLTTLALTAVLSITMLSGCSQTKEDKKTESGVTAKEVIQNLDARIAISSAFDKSGITDTLLNNGSVEAQYFVSDELVYDDEGNSYREYAKKPGYKFDKTVASDHWQKAKDTLGFEKVEIELLMTDSDTSKKIAEYIKGELETNLEGLTINLKQVPFEQKQELASTGDYEIVQHSWIADYPDPSTFLDTFVTDSRFSRECGYSNEEYDQLVKDAKQSADVNVAWEKFAQAEKMLLEEAYIAPIYQSASASVQRESVDGIVVSLYGARNGYKWTTVEGKDSLNLTSMSDILSLDSSKTTDSYSFDVLNNIMDGLTRVNLDDEIVEASAKDWVVSEDGLTYTFNMNPDAKWENGDPVTAHDFEYAWKRTLNPETTSEYAFIMYDIVGAEAYNMGEGSVDEVGVKAIDDLTLEVKLNRPVNYFERLVGFPVFFPQNQKFVESCGDKYGIDVDNIMGNGPYKMSTWKMEDQYSMTKSETYWDKDVVTLQEINTKISKDGSTSINLYEAGEIDRAGLVADNVENYKDTKEFKTDKDATTQFLQFNVNN